MTTVPVKGTVPARGHAAPGEARRLVLRRLADRLWWSLCAAALLGIVVPVVWVLAGVVGKGVRGWQWSVLTTTTQGTGGGLANAIMGTLVIVAGVLVIAGSVGVAGGVYLAEFCRDGRGGLLRGASEVLAGVPSIVLGYVGYIVLVVHFHWGFSLLSALLVLSAMVVPYIVKTTEVALRNVPTAYRDGSEALGMPRTYALRRVVLRPAVPGIVTGLILAMAIAIGETAPLLYTANWSNGYPSAHLLHAPVAYLTYPVWTFYNQPQTSAHRLSAEAALLLVALVVVLIGLSRLVVARTQRHTEGHRGAR